MLNLNRSNFQAHPFHLVSPSPWPIILLTFMVVFGIYPSPSIVNLSELFAFSNLSDFVSYGHFGYPISCDAPRAWGLYFQDSASPGMEVLVELHDNIMYYLVAILLAVGWIQAAIIRNFRGSRSPIRKINLGHTLIELLWTIIPALILILMTFPSFKLLYLMDEVTDPSLSVLAEGHWSYEYPDFLNSEGDFVEFDSCLTQESDLEEGSLVKLGAYSTLPFTEPEPQDPVPGRRCQACLERGDTVWVIPGKCCPVCGTPVN